VFFSDVSLATSVRFNKYECTMDQELADTAEYAPGRRCDCTHQVVALFWMRSVTSYQKCTLCQSMCIYWRTFQPKFILSRFETMKPQS